MKRCYGCFQLINDSANACPYCGYMQNADNPKWILPQGTVLNNKYEVGRMLGEGGFGITYLAWDINMETKIAIKEYFPTSVVSRDVTAPSGNSVSQNITTGPINFEDGMKKYVKEASILSRFFELPGIVSVKDFFYENGTAYFVMEYIEGMSLKDYLKSQGGKIGYEEALALVQPVISSLFVIHQNNMLHRDISPDNIMISNDGTIKLIDFGAAREFNNNMDNSMSVILKHGFAPIEQYSRNGQGPYTDVYGVCAVLYRMVTGEVPASATDRVAASSKKDPLVPIRKKSKGVPRHVAAAIQKGLSILPEHRQQNMQQLYDDLYVKKESDVAAAAVVKTIVTAAVIMLALTTLGIAYKVSSDRAKDAENTTEVASSKNIDEDSSNETRSRTSDEGGSEGTASETSDSSDTQTDSDNTVSNARETAQESAQATDASSTGYETYQYGTSSDSEIDMAIEAVQNGVLDSSNTPVKSILEAYSDSAGIWEGYRDENDQLYVKYSGTKDGDDFAIIFEITSNKSNTSQVYISFRVAGALLNNELLDNYNTYFKQIMDSYH